MLTQFPSTIFRRLEIVSNQVKTQLQKKGLAIPDRDDNGNIVLGNYTIVKNDNFYAIVDYAKEVIVDKINLPQTAVIVANDLALGKFLNHRIINIDRHYGYAELEEKLHTRLGERSLKKNVDNADVMFTKSKIKRDKKESYKREIVKHFEKLHKIT